MLKEKSIGYENYYLNIIFWFINSVEQPILKENERLWILKLVHTDEARSKIFRASTEPDLNVR